MKITIEHYDSKVTWSNDIENQKIDNTTSDEAIEAFLNLLVVCGYVKSGLEDYIVEKAELLKESDTKKEDL